MSIVRTRSLELAGRQSDAGFIVAFQRAPVFMEHLGYDLNSQGPKMVLSFPYLCALILGGLLRIIGGSGYSGRMVGHSENGREGGLARAIARSWL